MVRVTAWAVLRSGSQSPLRQVDRFAADRGLEGRDRALVRRLVGVEIRHRATLRVISSRFTRRKAKPDMAAHLHLGIAQLIWFDRIPDHAVFSEAMGAVEVTLGQSKVGHVRDVLRSVRQALTDKRGDSRHDLVDRELGFGAPIFHDEEEHPALWAEELLNIPAPLIKRWTRRFGPETTRALGLAFLREPELSVRVMQGERDALRAEFEALETTVIDGAHERTLHLPADAVGVVTGTEAFEQGRFLVQGDTAAAAVDLMQANEGERLLDLCAAPGGKTMTLLASGAQVCAVDVDGDRLGRVRDNAERLELAQRLETVVSDGTKELDAGEFDGVLVDAPCSNTGVLGARPAARWRFGPRSQASLRELQTRLLNEGAARVRSGGRLVWSTCSLEPEENERLVKEFLAENAGWQLEDQHLGVPVASEGGTAPIDGGQAIRLRRR